MMLEEDFSEIYEDFLSDEHEIEATIKQSRRICANPEYQLYPWTHHQLAEGTMERFLKWHLKHL
jgi:hypothetical protein